MNPFWQDFQPKSKAVDSVVGIGVQLLIIIQGGWLLFDVAFIYSFIIMMVDNGNNNDNVFIYMGGDQEVPLDVTHAIVDRSVDTIRREAFSECRHLVWIKMHDGVGTIGKEAFSGCISLRSIKLPGVRVIGAHAFEGCEVHGSALEDVEFGDKLETIGNGAFFLCDSLRNIKIPKVRVIGESAFWGCGQLTDVELLSEDLERIENDTFEDCYCLRRIAIPLRNNLFGEYVFNECSYLTQVDLVGGIHKSISSLHLESWKSDMYVEIDRINQDLPNTPHYEKTAAIQQWIGRVVERMEHYTSEHYALLKDNMTQLELALWKSKLHEMEGEEFSLSSDLCVSLEKKMTFLEFARWKAKVDEEFADAKRARHEARVNCGANIIIPHVLSFLNDEDVFPTLNHNS